MNSFGNPSQPGFQPTQNQPTKTNSVIVARELFADDSPTDSEPIEKSRPARPPPPTPSAVSTPTVASPVQQRPISLINFSSPETLSPTEKSKTIAPKMVDNYRNRLREAIYTSWVIVYESLSEWMTRHQSCDNPSYDVNWRNTRAGKVLSFFHLGRSNKNIKSSLFRSFEPMTFWQKLSSQSKVFYLSGHQCHYHHNQYRQHTLEVQLWPEVMPEVQPEVKPKILHHQLRGFIRTWPNQNQIWTNLIPLPNRKYNRKCNRTVH